MLVSVIIDGHRHPALNMALDETLARYAGESGELIIRLYWWLPAGISIGRRQPITDVRLDVAAALGVVPVRRPTGGRAIIHLPRDLTYSIAIPRGHPFYTTDPGRAAYLAATIVSGMLSFAGVPARPGGIRRYVPRGPICLNADGSGDIYVDGYKVSGAAVLVRPRSVLVHGTVIVEDRAGLWYAVVRADESDRRLFREKVAGLSRLGYSISANRLTDSLVRYLEERYGLEPVVSSVPSSVFDAAFEVAVEKYMSEEWIHGGRP